jgi:hypothetical protein
MRRLHLRGRENILKRLLVHGAAFNLSLLLRKYLGAGTPREFQALYLQVFSLLWLTLDDFSPTNGLFDINHFTAKSGPPKTELILVPRAQYRRSAPVFASRIERTLPSVSGST